MKNVSIENIDVKRKDVADYPRIAIREFVANALVHQDFDICGISITIEIFSNRVVITNPGAPLNDINRLIDLHTIKQHGQYQLHVTNYYGQYYPRF
jgi:ATP-dependent DNA helicase RecG